MSIQLPCSKVSVIIKGYCFIFLLLLIGCENREALKVEEKHEKPLYEGTIIAVGNSLTAGYGLDEEEAYPALLREKLHEEGYKFNVINAGISGETSSGALSRIKWILAQKPDIVILETGANDGLRGIESDLIKKNISEAVKMLREDNVEVILAGMQMVQNLGSGYTGAFAKIYPDISREQEVLLIPFFLKGVAGEPSLNQDDTIHPAAEGYKIIVETVYPYVLQAIKRRAADNR